MIMLPRIQEGRPELLDFVRTSSHFRIRRIRRRSLGEHADVHVVEVPFEASFSVKGLHPLPHGGEVVFW